MRERRKEGNDLRQRFRDWYNDQVAEGADNFFKFHYHLWRQMEGIPLAGRRVLEVGCGKGALALYLALFCRCRQVVALDESAGEGSAVGVTGMLRQAAEAFGASNLTVVETDIMNNRFPDSSFHVIVANSVLHHVVDSGFIFRDPQTRADYVRLLSELKRVLVPDGIMTLVESSRISLWRWSPLKLRQKHIEWDLHPTLSEWLAVIGQAGLRLSRVEPMVPYPLRWIQPLLVNPVAQFALGPLYMIRLQK